MAPTCLAQFSLKNVCGRKRAFPTPSRNTWIIVYAVTFSASVVATIAFQQSLPISFCHSLSPAPRASTTAFVLIEPMNLVTIESKKSVEDRAALEELYILSSLAKKATRRKALAPQKMRRKTKVTSPFIDNNQNGSASKLTGMVSSNFVEIREDILDDSTLNTSIVNHRSRRILNKKNISKATERKSSHVQTRSYRRTPSKHSSPNSKRSEKVEDKEKELDDFMKKTRAKKFLTTVPNRRNQKKKKTPVECIAIDQDEYIRSLLQKKEKYFSHDFQSSSNGSGKRSPRYVGISEQIDAKSSNLRSKPLNMVYSSRSSTMPGFRGGKKKVRNKNFTDAKIDLLEPKNDCGQSMYMTSNSVPDSLVQFVNEIHNVDRITPEEEIMLGEKTQEALRLQHIYDGLLAKLEREPTDDEWCAASGKFNMEAITQIIDEGLEAKNKLVTSNLRMVQGVVNVYIRNGLHGHYNAGDLMQEGILVSTDNLTFRTK